MRKAFTVLICVVLSVCCKGQFVDIPDVGFRYYLHIKYPTCFNNVMQLDTTCTSIVYEDSLDVNYYFRIYNLDGIQYFKNLKKLKLEKLKISELGTLPSQLIHLNISYCDSIPLINNLSSTIEDLQIFQCSLLTRINLPPGLKNCTVNDCYLLTSIASLPSYLKYFNCSNNRLAELPALFNSLETLICYNNNLTYLPNLPITLKYLECNNNSISTIPYLPNSLTYLSCGNNPLLLINSFSDSLKTLYCQNGLLTVLPPFTPNLKTINCSKNSILQLPNLPLGIDSLICFENNLTQLPNLPTSITVLNCSVNQLYTLPFLPQNMVYLNCNNNHLNTLPNFSVNLKYINILNNNIFCLPTIPVHTNWLTIEMDNKIKCLPNFKPNLIINTPLGSYYPPLLYPICTPISNSSKCQAFPIIKGTVFFDTNNNGIRENNEPLKANAIISLSNGKYAFTNNEGYYELDTDSIGQYSIKVNAPENFSLYPSFKSFIFLNNDTTVTTNHALTPIGFKDSLSIQITPLLWAARPGFPFPYIIHYENAGTTTMEATLNVNYDITKLIYDSSSNNNVFNSSNKLSIILSNCTPGKSGSFICYFDVKNTAALNSSITTQASIRSNTYQIIDSSINYISGAFDPNDKQSTPELSPNQVAAGNYINYTIRFQNTGNDTAFNVVISDTLSNLLKSNSLQLTASSQNCKTTVQGDKVFFEFLNILLPDSNVNELKSHGFVSFKIKPINTLVLGDEIPNTAAIYFDYNSPIITNTATTTIKMPPAPPIKLISFTATAQTFNNNILFWSTMNELSAFRFDIEQSIDSSSFSTISTEIAKGQMSNNYSKIIAANNEPIIYYRLKMIDRNGQFIYSNIVADKRNGASTPVSILNNPTSNILNIGIQDAALQNTTAIILNAQGAVVLSVLLHNNIQQIDVSKLPNGNYLLQTIKGISRFIILK